jgi:hypothetical protein
MSEPEKAGGYLYDEIIVTDYPHHRFYFLVGAAGTLYIRANDGEGLYGDNSGNIGYIISEASVLGYDKRIITRSIQNNLQKKLKMTSESLKKVNVLQEQNLKPLGQCLARIYLQNLQIL